MSVRLTSKIGLALVLLAAACVYSRSIYSGFQHDDWGFLSLMMRPHFNPLDCISTWFYRPVFLIAFTSLYKAFGMNPLPWHVVEVAIHLLNVCLVYKLATRLGFGRAAALGGAIAFGVFPQSADAVQWLSALSGLIAACLGLTAAHIAISSRIRPEIRGLLCSAVWICAIFAKEEAACLIVVLPFLPLLTGEKRTRGEWIRWGASCLPMVAGLCLLVHCEQLTGTTLGNAHAVLNARIIAKSIGFVMLAPWVSSLAPSDSFWAMAPLALIPLGLWKRHPSLRPGLLWMCGGGFALGITLGRLGPSDRYEYIPSIGLALCICSLITWLKAGYQNAQMPTRLGALVLVCCMVGNYVDMFLPVSICLVLFLMGCGEREPHIMSNKALLLILAAGLISRATDFTISHFFVNPTPASVTVVISWSVAALAILILKLMRLSIAEWAAMGFCSLEAFISPSGGVAELVVAVLAAEVLILGSPWIERTVGRLRTDRGWVWSAGAIVITGMIVASWSVENMVGGVSWTENGIATQRAVRRTAEIMRNLPRNAEVGIVDAAGVSGAEPRIWKVTAGMIAGRPDLRVSSAWIVPNPVRPSPIPNIAGHSVIYIRDGDRVELLKPGQEPPQ